MKQHDNCKFCIGAIKAKATGKKAAELGRIQKQKALYIRLWTLCEWALSRKAMAQI